MTPHAARRKESWQTIAPGMRRKAGPVTVGPWFQYYDAAGFEWNTFEVDLPDLPRALDGFRIIHLSDLHCQPHWQSAYDELTDRLNADEPDLILITGDVVDFIRNPEKCLPTAKKFLRQLHAKHGMLGLLGNHDENLKPAEFDSTPLQLIDGKRVLIEDAGAPLELIAVPGPLRTEYPRGFDRLFPPKQPGVPRIVLSHYPDHIRRMRSTQPDIFLSGHTHGGQICLPGRIPLLRHDALPIRYFHGAHRLYGSHFFVNRGFGFSTFPVRIFCPAEVIELRLRRKAD